MRDGPGDYVLRCGLNALLAINTAPLFLPLAASHAPVLTVCFWVKAQAVTGDTPDVQVIVNCGHRHVGEPGWSCFLYGGRLVISVCSLQGQTAAVDCAYPGDGCWHHVAAMIVQDRPTVRAALDGSQALWAPSATALCPGAPAGGVAGLMVGGYTDAAGGHFDFTFGREGRGMLDDLRVYLRALAEDELARLGARPDGVSAGAAGSRAAATITWSPHAAAAPVRLRFAAEVATGGPALNESAADGTKYLWTWPDGTRSVGSVVERAFAYGGVYRVHLDVIGEDHAEATAETVVELEGPLDPLRLTPVFRSGEGEYAAFRIPSIVCAANGNLVAFAEGRVQSASDSAATIHIVCKVSADNGRTWGPLGVVARNVVAGVEYAAMNPSPVVDTQCGTGRIVLLFKKLECSEWEIARGHGLMRTFCVCSDDHGQTWWGERDITAQVHRPYLPALQERYPYAAQAENAPHDWRIQVPTLGHAIQLEGPGLPPALRGRILHIGSRTHGNSSVFASMNYAFWSDDLGENWEIGPTIAVRDDGMPAVGLNEATVVELPGGQVLVNSRNYREGAPVRRRAVTRGTFTSDGQLVFGPAGDDAALIEPPVQASLLRLCWAEQAPGDQRSRILFANPAHPFARVNLTVRVSYDEGATWPISRVIDRGPSAYSDLVVQADGEIGLLYERGNAGGIFYATFPLDWLEEGEEAANG